MYTDDLKTGNNLSKKKLWRTLKVEMGAIPKLMISCIDYVLLSNALTFIHVDNPIDFVNACKIESYFQKVQ